MPKKNYEDLFNVLVDAVIGHSNGNAKHKKSIEIETEPKCDCLRDVDSHLKNKEDELYQKRAKLDSIEEELYKREEKLNNFKSELDCRENGLLGRESDLYFWEKDLNDKEERLKERKERIEDVENALDSEDNELVDVIDYDEEPYHCSKNETEQIKEMIGQVLYKIANLLKN